MRKAYNVNDIDSNSNNKNYRYCCRIVNVTVLRPYFIIRHCYIGVSPLAMLRLDVDDYPLLSLTIVQLLGHAITIM